MAKEPLDQIVWATPENPKGLWAYCVICNKDIRELRTRKIRVVMKIFNSDL